MIKNKPIFKLSSFLKEELSEKDNISQMLLDKVLDILSNNNITIKRKRINFQGFAINASQANNDPSANPYLWTVEFIFDLAKNMSKIGLVCHDWMKIEREKQILVDPNNLDSFEDEVQMLIKGIEHDKQLLREHDFILPVQEIINDIIVQESSHSFLGKKDWETEYRLTPGLTMHCYLKTNNKIIVSIHLSNIFLIQNLEDTFEENFSQSFDSQKTPEVFRNTLNNYFKNLQARFVAGRVSQADLGIS